MLTFVLIIIVVGCSDNCLGRGYDGEAGGGRGPPHPQRQSLPSITTYPPHCIFVLGQILALWANINTLIKIGQCGATENTFWSFSHKDSCPSVPKVTVALQEIQKKIHFSFIPPVWVYLSDIVHCTDGPVLVLLYLFCILTLHSSAVDITGRILGVLSGGAAQSGDPGYRHTQRQWWHWTQNKNHTHLTFVKKSKKVY